MGKSQQYAVQRKQGAGGNSERKRVSRSSAAKSDHRRDGMGRLQQLETIFASLPVGIIACDREGRILQLNDAALQLFEATSELQWQGKDYQEFLKAYTLSSEQHSISSKPYQKDPGNKEEAVSRATETIMLLQVPSGQRITVDLSSSQWRDVRQQVRGMVYAFRELSPQEQRVLHLQHVYEAVLTLTKAIARLPKSFPAQVASTLCDESFLPSPPVVYIAQQLVDVIRRVLNCHRASLKALAWPAGYLHFVAGSGFTAGEEAPERTTSDIVTLSEAFDETQRARLFAKQEVVVRGDQVYVPPGLGSFASESLLIVPLFCHEQLTGLLCITKAGVESTYTPEEVKVVKAVAAQAILIVECLRYLYRGTETHTREQVLYEVRHLSNDFLALASHELRTPLTGIIGNLQLARRRLEALQHQITEQAESINEYFAQAQQPLASASQSARLQQRMINDLIDDARIQTNQLELNLQSCDLLMLLQTAIGAQQQLAPGRTIILERKSAPPKVPVLVDTERIARVFTTYLANALLASPAREPVTVYVTVEDRFARVSVHDEGPGIPQQEQEHLWERFYRSKGSGVQHELDLSLGLALYLCRALIELHGGHVGVESTPGHGATFWLTLPIAPEE